MGGPATGGGVQWALKLVISWSLGYMGNYVPTCTHLCHHLHRIYCEHLCYIVAYKLHTRFNQGTQEITVII